MLVGWNDGFAVSPFDSTSPGTLFTCHTVAIRLPFSPPLTRTALFRPGSSMVPLTH